MLLTHMPRSLRPSSLAISFQTNLTFLVGFIISSLQYFPFLAPILLLWFTLHALLLLTTVPFLYLCHFYSRCNNLHVQHTCLSSLDTRSTLKSVRYSQRSSRTKLFRLLAPEGTNRGYHGFFFHFSRDERG